MFFFGERKYVFLFSAHPPPSKGTWPWARKVARGIGHPRALLNPPPPSLLVTEQEKTKQKREMHGMGAAPLGDHCGPCSAPRPDTVLGATGHVLPAPRTVPKSSHPVPKLGMAAGAQGVAGPRAQQGHGAARLGLQCCLCAVRGTPGCHRARRAPAVAAEVLGVSWASRRSQNAPFSPQVCCRDPCSCSRRLCSSGATHGDPGLQSHQFLLPNLVCSNFVS